MIISSFFQGETPLLVVPVADTPAYWGEAGCHHQIAEARPDRLQGSAASSVTAGETNQLSGTSLTITGTLHFKLKSGIWVAWSERPTGGGLIPAGASASLETRRNVIRSQAPERRGDSPVQPR